MKENKVFRELKIIRYILYEHYKINCPVKNPKRISEFERIADEEIEYEKEDNP